MSRITEFQVGKTGRLIGSFNAVLDVSGKPGTSVRAFETGFLTPAGTIFKLYVPVHCLTNKSTSHDRTLHKQLKAILLEGQIL